MTDDPTRRHRQITQISFEKQADAFSRSPLMTDRALLMRLVEWTGVEGDEDVLDVACGPGLVATAFAPHVRRVVAVDVTPAMLARGIEIASEQDAGNVRFVRADVAQLPFADASFDRVVARRAFHHFPAPASALAEMARVCAPTGAIVIEDQALPADPRAAEAMTTIDRLRDPSHTRAISPETWPAMFAACGLSVTRLEVLPRELEVDEWLPRAQPTPAAAARVRDMLDAAAHGAIPGLEARYVGGRLRFSVGFQMVLGTFLARPRRHVS